MTKNKAKQELGELAVYWSRLPDQQKQATWDTFTKDEKNAVHILFGVDGLPEAVQVELKDISKKEAPCVKQAVNGSGEGGDTLPVPYLAELNIYDKLAMRPVVHPLWAKLDSMVEVPEAPSRELREPEPTIELSPEILDMLSNYTVEEAEVVGDSTRVWAGMLFSCVVIVACACVVFRVLCL